MCGLVYARGLKPGQNVSKDVLKMFINQRSRGIEGFGLYDVQYQHLIKTPKELKIRSWLIKHPSEEILFHHRMPTSTANVKNACHPFSTGKFFGDKEYILIHNGYLFNEDDLANAHYEQGIQYTSLQPNGDFNDSEALLWDFALFLEGKQKEPHAVGQVALICIEKTKGKESKLHYYRNGRPLYLRQSKKMFALSSESMKDTNSTLIQMDMLFSYDYKQGSTTKREFKIPGYKSSKNYNLEPRYESLEDRDDYMSNYLEELDDEDENIVETRKLALIEDRKNLANDLKEKCAEWLSYCNGYYELAIGMMREEIDRITEKLKDDDIEAWYNLKVLEGGVAILLADPFWSDGEAEARHPVFIPYDDADAVRDTVTPARTEHEVSPPVEERITAPEVPKVLLADNQTTLKLTSPPASHVHRYDAGRKVETGATIIGQVLKEGRFGVHHPISDTPGLTRRIPTFRDVGTA